MVNTCNSTVKHKFESSDSRESWFDVLIRTLGLDKANEIAEFHDRQNHPQRYTTKPFTAISSPVFAKDISALQAYGFNIREIMLETTKQLSPEDIILANQIRAIL